MSWSYGPALRTDADGRPRRSGQRAGPPWSGLFVSAALLLHLCGPALARQDGPAAATLEIRLSLPPEISLPEPIEAQLDFVLESNEAESDAAGNADRPSSFSRTTSLPGLVRLGMPPGHWRLTSRVAAFWAAPRTLDLKSAEPSAGTTLELAFEPAGTITGRVQPEKGSEPARGLGVRFGGVEQAGLDLRTECPITESGFRCSLPAGTWDLQLRAPGYVSHHRWGLKIEPGEAADLGVLKLVSGASVVGYVTTATGEDLPAEIEVEASRPGADTSGAKARKKAARAKPRPNGYFHLGGLEPGPYHLRASAPGWVDGSVEIRALAGRQAELRYRIELERPLRLSVAIDPATDPEGRAWLLELIRTGGGVPGAARLVGKVDCDLAGWCEKSRVGGGEHMIRIQDRDGRSFGSEQLILAEEPMPVQIRLDMTPVEGEVSVGGEGVPGATLYFGGRRGAVSVTATTGEDGVYQAILPRPGRWVVEIEAVSLMRRLNGIEVDRPEGEERARLDFELPNTRVAGSVVGDGGETVPRAIVFAEMRGATGFASVDVRLTPEDGGEFELYGLPVDTSIRLFAESPGGSSRPHELQLAEGRDVSGLILQISEPQRAVGRVVHGGAVVPGASVAFLPLGRSLGGVEFWRTDSDGVFEATLPELGEYSVHIQAPGYAMGIQAVTLTETGQELTLSLGTESGEVSIPPVENPEGEVSLLFWQGLLIPDGFLRRWRSAHPAEPGRGGSSRLLRMPPGTYRLCHLSRQQAVLVEQGLAHPTRCTTDLLQPNGSVDLRAP